MLKDLISYIATYLKLDDVYDYLVDFENNSLNEENININKPEDITLLTNLSNLVIRQIAREFMPLYESEEASSNDNCEILYSNFKHEVNKITSVCFLDNLATTFRTFPQYVKVGYKNRRFNVMYSYIPNELTNLNDRVVKPLGLSNECIALGVCAEYCLINSLYDEADMWESKFKTSLANASRTLRERKLPTRGWL